MYVVYVLRTYEIPIPRLPRVSRGSTYHYHMHPSTILLHLIGPVETEQPY